MKALIIAAVLALATGSALADGVPLFQSRTATPTDRAFLDSLKRPGVESVTAIKLNRFAQDSNVITATVDGKSYRFVVTEQSSDRGIDSWRGTDKNSRMASLILVRDKTDVYGTMVVGGRAYEMTDTFIKKLEGGR